MKRLTFAIALWLLAISASAATISVRRDGSGDYSTLQPAFDIAAPGDTILVGPGEYTEWSMERLSGYSWDVKTFGRIVSQDLTLIGAGVDQTIIGPTDIEMAYGQFSPKCLVYRLNAGWLRISDLTLRNCYDGLSMVGTLYMERCRVYDSHIGVSLECTGDGGWIKETRIETIKYTFGPTSASIGHSSTRGPLLENCCFEDYAEFYGVYETLIRNCDIGGVILNLGARVNIYGSRMITGNVGVGASLGGGCYCEIYDSELKGEYSALGIGSWAPRSSFVVRNSRLEGGTHGVLSVDSYAAGCSIRDCDLVKGSGPMVECVGSRPEDYMIHNMTNNYWGTTDEAEIQSWIIDRRDDSSLGAIIQYSPFAGQSVPNEEITWGELKASFR